MVKSRARVLRWGLEVQAYLRQASRPADFLRVMRTRLSLSRVGRVVCRDKRYDEVSLRDFGGPVWLRSHSSDISVLNELVVSHGYTRPVQLIPPPSTIVDLGANTGLAARWFMHRFPGATVVAVEPEPGNISVLERNLRGSGALVVAKAVGGTERKALLHTDDGEYAFTLVGEAREDSIEVEVVAMRSVLDALHEPRVGLLKADIEGSEAELFHDCAEWIGSVDAMIVECHDGYTGDQLIADCARGGAVFEVVDLDSKPELRFEVVTAVRSSA